MRRRPEQWKMGAACAYASPRRHFVVRGGGRRTMRACLCAKTEREGNELRHRTRTASRSFCLASDCESLIFAEKVCASILPMVFGLKTPSPTFAPLLPTEFASPKFSPHLRHFRPQTPLFPIVPPLPPHFVLMNRGFPHFCPIFAPLLCCSKSGDVVPHFCPRDLGLTATFAPQMLVDTHTAPLLPHSRPTIGR